MSKQKLTPWFVNGERPARPGVGARSKEQTMIDPTDAELEALFVEETNFSVDDFPAAILGFARAVLAKWGTTHPTQAQTGAVPLTGEMQRQMKERCDSYEMRGAFADGWLSAEAAHGIKGGQHGAE